MIGIYKITSPTNRIYIGQSIDVENRFKYYKRLKCKGQFGIYNSLLKYGVENHTFEIIEECNIDQLNIKERFWQDEYDVLNKGLNCKLTKTTDKSGRASKESVLKRSGENNCWFGIKGESHPLFGRKHSEASKKKMSKSQKGNKSYWYGKKLSKESVDKRVSKVIGIVQSKEHINKRVNTIREKTILLNTLTGIYYYGFDIAAHSINMHTTTFWQQLTRNKKNKTNFIIV